MHKIPHQVLTRGKVLGDCVFDTLERFCQPEYDSISWLFLITLDKVRKDKDDSGIQIPSSRVP